MNIGNQVNRARKVALLIGRAKSGLIKPERTISLKNGPPFVREKSSKFRDNGLSINEETDVREFYLFIYLRPAQAFFGRDLDAPSARLLGHSRMIAFGNIGIACCEGG
jgi:hypothetical protein